MAKLIVKYYKLVKILDMKKYLKPNVAIEPLFCSWYLWSYLVSPHTAGYFLKNRYLRIMKSFLESPELHRLAANNPKVAGGQFLNLDDNGLKKIESIVMHTEKEAGKLLQLANDITSFNELVQTKGDGSSLEPLYQAIPDSLKGCVELVYDQDNHPKINFFERIIYDKYYDSSLQSVILTPLKNDLRSFVLSTPRIALEKEISLPLNFNSNILSQISRSRSKGVNLEKICEELLLDNEGRKLFNELFSDIPFALTDAKVELNNIRLRYFGHACILLETSDVSILIDPVVSYFQPEGGIERFTFCDLPEYIDYVVFSHNHLDHISFETLIFLKDKVKNFIFPQSSSNTLINPNLRIMFQMLGFNNLLPVDYLEDVQIPGGRLFSFPFLGEHGDLDIQSKSAFYIEIFGHKFLFAADSNNLDNGLYEYLYNKVGAIDTVFIGMECVGGPLDWIYGPLLSKKIKYAHKQSRRYSGSDSQKAVALIQSLQAKEVFVYAMGQEPWLSHITSLNYEETSPQMVESNIFIDSCRSINIPCKRLYGKDEWQYGYATSHSNRNNREIAS